MAKKSQKRAQSPHRPLDLQTVKAFWDIMSQHFGNFPIDLSLFNYKAKDGKSPLVRQKYQQRKLSYHHLKKRYRSATS